MPIRPENKARYPRDWKQIRAAILERAGHRCEQCGIKNRAWRNNATAMDRGCRVGRGMDFGREPGCANRADHRPPRSYAGKLRPGELARVVPALSPGLRRGPPPAHGLPDTAKRQSRRRPVRCQPMTRCSLIAKDLTPRPAGRNLTPLPQNREPGLADPERSAPAPHIMPGTFFTPVVRQWWAVRGSREACRVLRPVCYPVQSAAQQQ